MQAIILAAGMGRRLGDLTKENTKCMVPVNGVRLIDRLLGQLSGLSLKRVIIVVGYKGQELKDYIGHRYDDQLKIAYAENPIYDKTNNIYSLSLVKQQLQEDDTLLIESDLIFSDSLFQMIIADPYPILALVAKYESWMDGTMVRLDADNNIVNFVPKKAFKYEDIDSYYKTVNIYKFSRDFSQQKYVPFLEAYCHALGNNEYYEQVLRVITLLDHAELKALPIGNEKWYEIDDIQDLDIAETIFAEGDEMLHRFNYRYGGHWRFPKMLDYCYLVNPYFPTKRMKDELRSSFDTLLTEYPSGMFVNSLLAGKYFGIRQDYVVVGNGAAELIKSLMERLLAGSSTSKVGVIYPTFEEYPHRLKQEDIVAFQPDNRDLKYTEDDLIAFYTGKGISSLLLINPDNPSGNFISMAGLQKLSYGVPGLRLGVLASSDVALIKWIKKDISIWNINSFAEFYMQIFGKYESDYLAACRKFIAERRRFEVLLREIPYMRVLPTQANYFCIELTGKYSSAELTKLLLERYNIMVKDCDSKNGLKGRNFIRISVRSQQDNDQLIVALKELS